MNWKPISSAPKETWQSLLLWRSHGLKPIVAYWHDNEWKADGRPITGTPSHWTYITEPK